MNYDIEMNLLKKYNQEHLLEFLDELHEEEKKNLLLQINNIDFETVEELIKDAKGNNKEVINESDLSPISFIKKDELSDNEKSSYYDFGLEILKNGQYAVVTMAGGQGTRLGHIGPKGTYRMDDPVNMSLFEIQCSRLKRLGGKIPWYIMTSKENDKQTKDFFTDNNYFGYGSENIYFFMQGMLPMVLTNGKIVLEEKGKIKEGADGHGGIFKAMISSGVLEDMKRRNIKWIFTCGIDNILTRFDDMVFLGLVSKSGKMIGAKSLIKRDAYEKVGVFCRLKDKPYVVEYTEVSDDMANAVDGQGNYVYGDAHILCNLFNISVFEKMGTKGLPYHVAVKKTEHIDISGNIVNPEKPNAFKFEAFIFDAFSYFDDMIVFRVNRNEEFAPVKNKEGEDSPMTALKLYMSSGELI